MIAEVHNAQAERKPVAVTVVVNRRPVSFTEKHATGAEIKAAAIAQGVPIQQNFELFIIKDNGNMKPIPDDERVNLEKKDEFRAIAPDDVS